MKAQEFANILNEAVTLDSSLMSIFNIMVPCSPVVGKLTRLELMTVSDHVAMSNVLGIINAMFEGERIYIHHNNGKPKFKVQVLDEYIESND